MTKRFSALFGLILICTAAFSQNNESSVKELKAYLVADAHLDTQWNWDVRQTILTYIPKTMERNFFLLERYPDYIFNFEGGIKYAWMKEYYPEQYELVKNYVKQGRWHISGASWDATDPNIPSTESFIRNILYGQHFYENEFGILSTDIFLPDCFGFSWTLPTVAAHCGLIGFSTQKLEWRKKPFYGNEKVPFEIGLWEGIDGNRIMIAPDGHGYGTNWRVQDLSSNANLIRLAEKCPLGILYHYYGTGDTGGSANIESVMAVEAGLDGDGPLEIVSATSDQLFKDFLPFSDHPELPVWKDELLMDVHATGCYTSQAAMKLFNRRNEQLADAAERSSVLADWLGKVEYPSSEISENWKRVIWHQFHDDITGTSIPRAYEFSWNDEIISLGQFKDIMTTSAGAVSSELNTMVKGIPVVIYNPSGFERSDIVEVSLPDGAERFTAVYDASGKTVLSQITSEGKLAFRADAPAVGYTVYDLRKGSPKTAIGVKVQGNVIENSIYKVTLDRNGDIASIFDKRYGRELVENGRSIRLAAFTDNASFSWPAWEILRPVMEVDASAVDGDVKISACDSGPVKGSIKVERNLGESSFCQYICLYEGADADRIDIINDVQWASPHTLLKAEFPLSVSNPTARYDLGIGSVERGNNTDIKYEVIAHQWADLTDADGSYGVSILNDCKYGWDKPANNVIRLTLLHTPQTRNGYKYQDRQDFGHHIFTYSIVGHKGDFIQGSTVRKAEELNQPLKAFGASRHKGSLGRSFSFASSDDSNVEIRALKKAEDSDAYVVRVYETSGSDTRNASVSFAADITEAVELDGNEKVIAGAVSDGKKLSFEIGPFGVRTFRVKLAAPQKTQNAGTECAPLELEYNLKAATFNAFRTDGNFDGAGGSYAAELLPERIFHKGITFELADPVRMNAMRCEGQEISLPQGEWNRLYLLAASTKEDVSAILKAGDTEQEIYVPYYGGFVGQWGHTGHTEGFRKNASIAYTGTHKHQMSGNADLPYDFTYMFFIPVEIPAGAKTVTLPDNKKIVIFAATAAMDRTNTLTELTDNLRISIPEAPVPEVKASSSGLVSGNKLIGMSGEINDRERAVFAVDDDPATKWCDASKYPDKHIDFDLGSVKAISSWYVLHAVSEAQDYITKSFALQVKDTPEDEWKTVDKVVNNTAGHTDRKLDTPVSARYARLLIIEGDQTGTNTARIYEFALYQ